MEDRWIVFGKVGMVDVPVGICSTSSRLVSGETPVIDGGASNLVVVFEEDRDCCRDSMGTSKDDTTPNMHAAQMTMPAAENFMRRIAFARSAAPSRTDSGAG